VKELNGWIPIGFEWAGSQPAVDWCYLGAMRFTEPFFENTMQRAMKQPFRVVFRRQTPIEVLEDRAAAHPGIAPTGFIFHMSRCGSTLISQMLAASDENVVISEGWPVESAINADARHPGVTFDQRRLWLRGAIHALGQPRLGSERRYFVKFDATHTIDLPLVRSAFPEVPWVFLYRDPVEVMVSQLRRRATWTMPGIVPIRGMALTAAAFEDHEEYIADLMAMICEAGLRAAEEPRGLLLNYSELPEAVYGKLAAHFRCQWRDDEIQQMRQAATRDAKQPESQFSTDGERKRREAGERVREICERKLGPVYRRLEARRSLAAGRVVSPV
jgi:hypothetical protein